VSLLMMRSTYQEYLARSLTEKYSSLSNQMDKIIENANAQITDMGSKMEGEYIA
jgi:E3 ubiquitin-protein ligase CCNP1IP1